MTVLRLDNAPLKRAKRLDNGWMRAPAHLTRTGVFEYRLGNGQTRRELRRPEEVFKADSLDSFDGVLLTDDHPREGLDGENAKGLAVGTVTKVRRDGHLVAADLLITDAGAVAKVESGKQELSCGYYCDTIEKPGVWVDANGRSHPYDAEQVNIRGNHVAIVTRGRAGPEARVRLDSADGEVTHTDGETVERNDSMTTKKITLDGVEVELPEHAAQLVAKVQTAHVNEVAKIQGRADALADENKGLKADLAKASDTTRFDSAVNEKVDLLDKARAVLGDGFKAAVSTTRKDSAGKDVETLKSNREIKVAVLAKLAPQAKFDGKVDAYVDARFDAAIETELAKNPATEAAREVVEGKTEPRNDNDGKGTRRNDTRSPEDKFNDAVFRDRTGDKS